MACSRNDGDPIVNDPAGMTTISGQSVAQSLKDCPGLSRSSAPAGMHSQSKTTESVSISPKSGFMNSSGNCAHSVRWPSLTRRPKCLGLNEAAGRLVTFTRALMTEARTATAEISARVREGTFIASDWC
jgi:hypothetical protein